MRDFAAGLHEIVVVEEKRAFLKEQLRSILYGTPDAPVVSGSVTPTAGPWCRPAAARHHRRRRGAAPPVGAAPRSAPATGRARILVAAAFPARTPYFCSGCPHNRSTVVPGGSVAGGGIGCHGMALFTRDRAVRHDPDGRRGRAVGGRVDVQLGAPCFQNIGDGTLAHSGSSRSRQAVSAGANVTFKILANGVVAMTGGQDAAGSLPIPALTRQLEAEGVRRIDVISDEPGRYGRAPGFAPAVRVHGRSSSTRSNGSCATRPGVTALIYDQACAAELRRERKRGRAPTPRTWVMINEAVCEGCGHCGDVSNCLSVRPVDTPFGRKTRIHQDSCNLDMSCIEGDCPAFVTVTPRGAAARPAGSPAPTRGRSLNPRVRRAWRCSSPASAGPAWSPSARSCPPPPTSTGSRSRASTRRGWRRRVDRSCRTCASATTPSRARPGSRRTRRHVPVFDLLTGVAPANMARLDPERTQAVVSTAQVPTGAMVADLAREYFPDLADPPPRLEDAQHEGMYLDAEAVALATFGSQPAANLIVVGDPYQRGCSPSRRRPSNGRSSSTASRWRRTPPPSGWTRDRDRPDGPTRTARRTPASAAEAARLRARVDGNSPAEILAWRVPELIEYQDADYAARYVDVVDRARRAELAAGDDASDFAPPSRATSTT